MPSNDKNLIMLKHTIKIIDHKMALFVQVAQKVHLPSSVLQTEL